MKKTAVLLYDTCCLFELTVALQMLKMAGKPVEYFAKSLNPIRTEEGMLIKADKLIENLSINEYDSLLITGAEDARKAVEDPKVLLFIDKFYKANAVIGAISIVPMFLLKLGYLVEKSFMIGCEKDDLLQEGFTPKDLKLMVGWRDSCEGKVPNNFLRSDKIITSVAFGFREWAMAIGKELGLEIYPKSFGL